MSTQIMPIVKFYVTKSSAVQGTIVDFQSVSLIAGVIDFSFGPGLGQFGAHVVHNANGTFSTTYSAHEEYYQTVAPIASRSSGYIGSPSDQSALVQVQTQMYVFFNTIIFFFSEYILRTQFDHN